MAEPGGARVGVIIAAAGVGERAGSDDGPKQFRTIAGVPMLLRAMRPFAEHPKVGDIVVVLPPMYVRSPPGWLREITSGRVHLVEGGETRALSVRAGLDALDPAFQIALVHDAARPFVTADIIDVVIATAAGGVGAVPAVKVTDTLKRIAEGSPRVTETIDRSGLWSAHTPQGFPRTMLADAYRRTANGSFSRTATDEAALVEAAGYPVHLVPGRRSNIKITTPDDFLLAETLAKP